MTCGADTEKAGPRADLQLIFVVPADPERIPPRAAPAR